MATKLLSQAEETGRDQCNYQTAVCKHSKISVPHIRTALKNSNMGKWQLWENTAFNTNISK